MFQNCKIGDVVVLRLSLVVGHHTRKLIMLLAFLAFLAVRAARIEGGEKADHGQGCADGALNEAVPVVPLLDGDDLAQVPDADHAARQPLAARLTQSCRMIRDTTE